MQTVLRLPVWLKHTASLPRGAVRAAAAGRDVPARPVEPGPEDCCQVQHWAFRPEDHAAGMDLTAVGGCCHYLGNISD